MIQPHQADFHVHPDYSIDAKGSIDEYCRSAISKGLKVICFTTHIDLNPEREQHDPFMRINGNVERMTPEYLLAYYNEIKSTQDKYAEKGLTVLAGIELDYFDGVKEVWENINPGIQFDYILGSIHCIDKYAFTWSIEAPVVFEKYPQELFYEKYYNSVAKLAETGIVDCIGHLDGYRKYARNSVDDGMNYPPTEKVKEALIVIKNSGIGIEINSAANRHGLGGTYPVVSILELASEIEVPIIALGSDSHIPSDLGEGFDISTLLIEKYKLRWKPII
ncbi:MAG: histidinol-phosphatase [candidate division Zixibacteria bacterium]|nr:histidinol-phosphatase [candidate division Zixibacteria bacterium]